MMNADFDNDECNDTMLTSVVVMLAENKAGLTKPEKSMNPVRDLQLLRAFEGHQLFGQCAQETLLRAILVHDDCPDVYLNVPRWLNQLWIEYIHRRPVSINELYFDRRLIQWRLRQAYLPERSTRSPVRPLNRTTLMYLPSISERPRSPSLVGPINLNGSTTLMDLATFNMGQHDTPLNLEQFFYTRMIFHMNSLIIRAMVMSNLRSSLSSMDFRGTLDGQRDTSPSAEPPRDASSFEPSNRPAAMNLSTSDTRREYVQRDTIAAPSGYAGPFDSFYHIALMENSRDEERRRRDFARRVTITRRGMISHPTDTFLMDPLPQSTRRTQPLSPIMERPTLSNIHSYEEDSFYEHFHEYMLDESSEEEDCYEEGIPEEMIEALPFTFDFNKDDKCIICFEPLDKKVVNLSCKHMFHLECIKTWTRKKATCPHCRQNVLDEDDDKCSIC